jgi:hypothetical protein
MCACRALSRISAQKAERLLDRTDLGLKVLCFVMSAPQTVHAKFQTLGNGECGSHLGQVR